MSEKSVCIVMSAYNGEKYIKEQIESLLKQSYKNLKIYVRDDGSKDNTKEILKKYESEKKIVFYQGENLGYGQSFLEILKKTENFDYYAFCDQDDVWLENKISRAVEKLEEMDFKLPLMYFSNLDVCNKELEHLFYNSDYKILSFANSITNYIASGNTMVINNKLRDILISKAPKELYVHDGYLYMLAASMGQIYYDKDTYIKYRKHSNCVTDQRMGFIQLQISRIKQIMKQGILKKLKKQLIEFEKLYCNDLNEKDKALLNLFTNQRYNIIKAIKKAFYKERYRQKIIDEILLRLIFVFGGI